MVSARTKTGIPGLDRLVEGGLPKNSITLVSGPPGTGKSILCLQYLYNGAMSGEPGLYVTFEQSEKDLLQNANKIGVNLGQLIKTGKIKVLQINPTVSGQTMLDTEDITDTIRDEAKAIKAKRIVIDSISSLINTGTLSYLGRKTKSDVVELGDTKVVPLVIDERPISRTIVWNAISSLKSTGCTCLATSELLEGQAGYSRDNISEFESDGIILLQHITSGGGVNRTLNVVKMRGTKIDDSIHPIDITPKGIVVKKREDIYK